MALEALQRGILISLRDKVEALAREQALKEALALAGRYVSTCWAKATKVRPSVSTGPIRPRCLACA
jgi:hypothetical protein